MSFSVRIDSEDHEVLKQMAAQQRRPMSELMSDAIRELKRKLVLEATNNGYRALQQDQAAWEAELDDRRAWDAATAGDADPDDWS